MGDVAGYVRVSTQQQRDDGSHERQRERLEEWADRDDHSIELFEDIAISGQSDERDAYEELMDRAGEFDAVAVRELSRFGRSLKRVLNDIDDLDEKDVDFISLQGDIDTTTAQGRLLLNMKAAFNQFWADLARERAMEDIERRRENDEPIGRPKKLNEEQIEEVREWREGGLSYGHIRTLVKEVHGVEVHRSTIRRYCLEDGDGDEKEAA